MSVRTRKTATVEIELPTVEDVIENTDDVTTVDVPPARKYFSHANCEHATKGDAGKAARAMCRRNVRAWLNAEAEYLATVAA